MGKKNKRQGMIVAAALLFSLFSQADQDVQFVISYDQSFGLVAINKNTYAEQYRISEVGIIKPVDEAGKLYERMLLAKNNDYSATSFFVFDGKEIQHQDMENISLSKKYSGNIKRSRIRKKIKSFDVSGDEYLKNNEEELYAMSLAVIEKLGVQFDNVKGMSVFPRAYGLNCLDAGDKMLRCSQHSEIDVSLTLKGHVDAVFDL